MVEAKSWIGRRTAPPQPRPETNGCSVAEYPGLRGVPCSTETRVPGLLPSSGNKLSRDSRDAVRETRSASRLFLLQVVKCDLGFQLTLGREQRRENFFSEIRANRRLRGQRGDAFDSCFRPGNTSQRYPSYIVGNCSGKSRFNSPVPGWNEIHGDLLCA